MIAEEIKRGVMLVKEGMADGMVAGAFMSLSGIALTAANIRPIFEMAQPLLKTDYGKYLTDVANGL